LDAVPPGVAHSSVMQRTLLGDLRVIGALCVSSEHCAGTGGADELDHHRQ
jgi:hypothetical protein